MCIRHYQVACQTFFFLKTTTWSQLDGYTLFFVICGSLLLGSDHERIHLTPKNNNMVPVTWVHPSFVVCGPLGPDLERSHLTPKKQLHGPSQMGTHPFSYYIRSLRARSRKKPFHTKWMLPLFLWIFLDFVFKWSGLRDP